MSRTNDVAMKRNLAQLLAVLCGWEYLLMLDDDMRSSPAGPRDADDASGGLRATDVVATFQATRELQAVGYTASDFPDHSVLGHLERRLGQRSQVFLGGTLWARVGLDMPFFSRAYNEDWLWVLAHLLTADDERRATAVMTGGELYQSAYDPFDQRRARSEELGDVLAEGLFAILAQESGEAVRAAVCDADAWAEIIRRRQLAITEAIHLVITCYSQQRSYGFVSQDTKAVDAMSASLAAYQGRSTRAWGETLACFAADWLADQETWRRFAITSIPDAPLDLRTALRACELESSTTWATRTTTMRLVVNG